jgi:hypothetical protein
MTRDEIMADCMTRNWRVTVFCSPKEYIALIAIESGLQIGYAKTIISEHAALIVAHTRAIQNYEILMQNREERLNKQPELWRE